MNCLKCGKQTKNENAFCPLCLEVMDAYPIKPDAHIQLPNHPSRPVVKKPGRKRRVLTVDEQVVYLRKNVHHLTLAVVLLSALLIFTSVMLVHTIIKQDDSNLGKNYTYDSTMD